MATCKHCNKEMHEVDGCKKKVYGKLDAIPYGKDHVGLTLERCGDCACKKGCYHHEGCDLEMCPKCKGQFITCECEIKGVEKAQKN